MTVASNEMRMKVAKLMRGADDPSAGAGVTAPTGSLYMRTAAGLVSTWQKTGAGDTNWSLLGTVTPPVTPFTTWTTITVPPTLEARWGTFMVWSEALGGIVLFGGVDGSTYFHDTWFLGSDGIWTEIITATNPGARRTHTMIDDPINGRVIMTGGYNGVSNINTTYAFDGTDWTALAPATTPTAGAAPAVGWGAYNALNDVGYYWLGGNGLMDLSDLATWNGSTWARSTPSVGGARHGATLVAVPWRSDAGAIFLMGGISGGTIVPATWALNVGSGLWALAGFADSPTPVFGHGSAYHEALDQVIQFGGATNNTGTATVDETWINDDTDWTLFVPVISPSSRWLHGCAYHRTLERVIILGGLTAGGVTLGDCWGTA